MNEWKQLLEQTHPKFSSVMTVEEALEKENSDDVIEPALELDTTNSDPQDPANEIEWISPTHKLQNKIENIPDKFGFKIGEAADYVGVKQYVLRYWETEFDQLKPKKSKNGQRMYTKKDVELALMIRKLLHDDRFSIEGAQAALKKLRQQVREKDKPTAKSANSGSSKDSIAFAQAMLENIRQAKINLNL